MATSGSIDFSLTAREVIDFALKKLRAVDSNRVYDAVIGASAQRELNLMLKGWQKYPSLWRLTEGSVAMTNAANSYALSPVPYFVASVRYRSSPGDAPLLLMTRGAYWSTQLKATAGEPENYYVDRQRATVRVYVYPVKAVVTTETLQYTYQRKFEDIDNLNDDLDVRQEWLEVVGYNLAARLAAEFGRAGPIVDGITKMADTLLQQSIIADQQDAMDAGQAA